MVQVTFGSESVQTSKEEALILWFEEVNLQDINLVGENNALLGEIAHQFADKGVKVPLGFTTTAYAYHHFIEHTGLETKLHQILTDLDGEDVQDLHKRGEQARFLVLHNPLPQKLEAAISAAYLRLYEYHDVDISLEIENQQYHKENICGNGTSVIIRSSIIAEKLPNASFVGWEETSLSVHGLQDVLKACHKCFASLFSDRAIYERTLKGLNHFDISLSVSIQKRVRSDYAPCGKIFSIDPVTGFKNASLITVAQGFGENVVQETFNPDEFFVFKPTLKEGFRPILTKRLGNKELKMGHDVEALNLPENSPVPSENYRYALNDEEILTLAKWACLTEDHYSLQLNTCTPIEMEWAKDKETGELFISQACPTVQSQRTSHVLRNYQLLGTSNVLVRGHAIGGIIGQGKVRVISNIREISELKPGEILVTNRTDPDWRPFMSKASAIVTDQGGRTCHSAISAREMGIPAIVGCGTATRDLQTGQDVTVCCAEGENGKVYEGLLPFEVKEAQLDSLPQTCTQILINVGNPEEAFSLASLPCDGVGVARSEFIIANEVKIHPLALVHFDEIKDPVAKREISALTLHYEHKPNYFVDKMAQGIGLFAAAFYPKPVIVRMSDFKSNEYANLVGGQQFEPEEENPMIGWRGASRYYDERYREAYHLECKALKRVRDEMGLTNIIPLIPFCRTPDEGRKVLTEMAKQGLKQGENGLEVYVMCETPLNVLLAEQFSEVFDGFSIGSNDLTQLIMGVDRDSERIDHLFDERNEGVKEMIRLVIEKAKKSNRKVGICGQAPSDYPDFVPFLVDLGIDSISLSPDSIIKTRLEVSKAEKALQL